jgi:O-antigen/teichoic acid export membrane protein
MLGSGILLIISNSSVALIGLLRNIIIARLVSVEDFGIASTLAITVAFMEMASNFSLDRLLVQARPEESQNLQLTAQLLQTARGIATGILILLMAEPIASLFGSPDSTLAFQLLACVPILRGLAHLDMFRAQREMRFGPFIAVELVSIAVSTAAVFPLYKIYADYRVMLFAILIQNLLFLILSHVVARNPYRWAWNPDVVGRAVHFGWPLMLNGLLMFGTFHGDRIIVGSIIGLQELAYFSAALTLTLPPTLVLAKTQSILLLPPLSQTNNDTAAFARLSLLTVEATLLATIIYALLFSLIAPSLLVLLYGQKYEEAAQLVVLLAVLQAFRLAKAGPATIAISQAQTKIPLIANLVRVLALPIAWFAATAGWGTYGVIIIAILGEILGFAVSLFLISRQTAGQVRQLAIISTITVALISWIGVVSAMYRGSALAWSISIIVITVGILAFFAAAHQLRNVLAAKFIALRNPSRE